MFFTNKVIVITGGAKGIGYQIADKLLENGAKTTILLDTDQKTGAEAVETLKNKHGDNKEVVFIKCDVSTDLEKVSDKIFESYTVDILVNNAGIVKDDDVKKSIDVNLTAVIAWGLKFWEHMTKHKNGKGGIILNMCSIFGYRVTPYLPIYQSSKFGVFGFTKSLGHEENFEKSGVKVVAICPGFTRTNLKSQCPLWCESHLKSECAKYLEEVTYQEADVVGKAAVEVLKTANSGTAWLIEESKPISEVK